MMTPARRWIVRSLLAACVLVPVVAVVLYAVNPHGAGSLDPRERVLGIGLYRVPSESMAPAYRPGDVLAIRAGAGPVRALRRGDVVFFAPPHHPEQVWFKRLVGLPGEAVEIHDGVLLVDGRAVAEPYVERANAVADYSRDMPLHRVAAGHVFLLGDNRDNSEDSRFWGDAALSSVRGRGFR